MEQAVVPEGVKDILAIAAGRDHSLALSRSGKVYAWGSNDYGESDVPGDLEGAVAIAAGDRFSVALLRDQSVRAWGRRDRGQLAVPRGMGGVVAIAAGGDHGLAILADGSVVGWGSNSHGQIDTPESVARATAIAAARQVSFAVLDTGEVVGWGSPSGDRLVIPTGLENVVSLSASASHALALRSDGAVVAWGRDRDSGHTIVPPESIAGGIAAGIGVSAMLFDAGSPLVVSKSPDRTVHPGHTFGLSVTCFGANETSNRWYHDGVLIDGAVEGELMFDSVSKEQGGLYTFECRTDSGGVTATSIHVDVVDPPQTARRSGTVVVWGDDSSDVFPVPEGLHDVVDIAAGSGHVTAVKRDGTVVEWGRNYSIFSNRENVIESPIDQRDVVAAAAASSYSLLLKSDGTVVQLREMFPRGQVLIDDVSDAIRVVADHGAAYAVRSDGAVVTWGSDGRVAPLQLSGIEDARGFIPGGRNLFLRPGGLLFSPDSSLPRSSPWVNEVIGVSAIQTKTLFSSTVHAALLADGTTFRSVTLRSLEPGFVWLDDMVQVNSGYSQISTDGLSVHLRESPLGVTGDLSDIVDLDFGNDFRVGILAPPSPYVLDEQVSVRGREGLTLVLTTRVVGSGPLRFEWYHGERLLAGADDFELVIDAMTREQAGTYRAVVIGPDGGRAEMRFEVTVDPVPDLSVSARAGRVYGWPKSDPLVVEGASLSGVVDVDLGREHGVAALEDGSVVVWGELGNSVGRIPADLTDVVRVAAGGARSIALQKNGRVRVWGASLAPELIPPTDLESIIDVDLGDFFTVALDEAGQVHIFAAPVSLNSPFNGDSPEGWRDIVRISAGPGHLLGLTAQGRVLGWGNNRDGARDAPVSLPPVRAISAGAKHSLALHEDGTVSAWGSDEFGQSSVPEGLANVLDIAAGAEHSLAVLEDGTVVSWGRMRPEGARIPRGLRDVTKLVAGQNQTLVLVDPAVPLVIDPIDRITAQEGHEVEIQIEAVGSTDLSYAWQRDGVPIEGESRASLRLPAPVSLDATGTYRVEIQDARGQVSVLDVDVEIVPFRQPIDGSGTVLQFRGGDEVGLPVSLQGQVIASIHSSFVGGLYAVREDGQAVSLCQGCSQPTIEVPVGVGPVVDLAVGSGFNPFERETVAVMEDGSVVAWDYETAEPRAVPEGVGDLVAVSSSRNLFFGLRSDGVVVEWGIDGSAPITEPLDLDDVIAIVGGENHRLALRQNGRVVAWGDNSAGQTDLPLDLVGVLEIRAASGVSGGRLADGTLRIWGGRTSSVRDVPEDLLGVKTFALGPTFGAAITNTDRLVLWGEHRNGFSEMDLAGLNPVGVEVFGDSVVAVRVAPESPVLRRAGLLNEYLVGHSASLGADFIGSGPLQYQWFRDGIPIAEATASRLEFSSVEASDGGSYVVQATDIHGNERDVELILNVLDVRSPIESIGRVEFFGELTHELGRIPAYLGETVVAIDIGDEYALALRADGTLAVWGPRAGFGPPPVEARDLVAIAAGSGHNLALRADGEVIAWKQGQVELSSVPEEVSGATAIAAYLENSIVLLHDGRVVGWHEDRSGAIVRLYEELELTDVVQFDVGPTGSFFLTASDELVAMGWGFFPWVLRSDNIGPLVKIAVGRGRVYGLREDGTIAEWVVGNRELIPVENDFRGVVDIVASSETLLMVQAGGSTLIREQGKPVYEGPRNVISASLLGSIGLQGGDGLAIVVPEPPADLVIASIELADDRTDEVHVILSVRDSAGVPASLEQLEGIDVEYTSSLSVETGWLTVDREIGPEPGLVQFRIPSRLENAFVRLVPANP